MLRRPRSDIFNGCFLTNAILLNAQFVIVRKAHSTYKHIHINGLFANIMTLLAYTEYLLTPKRRTKRNFASILELKTTDKNCEHLLCASLSSFWIRPMNDVKGCYVAANDVKTGNQPTTSILGIVQTKGF